MKKIIPILILLIVTSTAFGQVQEEPFWKKYIDEDAKELKLEKISESKFPLAIRIWTTFQMVELIYKEDSLYEGQLINYITKVNRKGRNIGVVSERLTPNLYLIYICLTTISRIELLSLYRNVNIL